MDEKGTGLYFRFFNEVGIIEQLARAMFEARLPEGFLVSHFSVLNHLIRVKDGQTPLQLTRAFQVPKTTMTHTLSGLEKHGLIEIRANPEDGRSKCVWLTVEGRAFRDRAIGALYPELEEMTTVTDRDTMRNLVAELEKVRIYLDQRRDNVKSDKT